MGKAEEEQGVLSIDVFVREELSHGCEACKGFISFRCFLLLFLGVSVLLSSMFWLPPFFPRHRPFTKGHFGATIEASFKLEKSVLFLNANIPRLEYDILEEIGVSDSRVVILSLEQLPGSNWTNVVFGVLPSTKNTTISSAGLSILRASFVELVLEQSQLILTPSIFGSPSFFQVLRYPGGITVVPPQNAFLLQQVQILFNFTLNNSVYQIQENLDELKNQLKSGLHLESYENLYVELTNLNGSTVAPPIIVQASIVRTVRNLPLAQPRLKQLAQTITGSPAKNLGLDHSVFGKVKQIQLSSFLQHSLNNSTSPAPSPQYQGSPPPPHHHLTITNTLPPPIPPCHHHFHCTTTLYHHCLSTMLLTQPAPALPCHRHHLCNTPTPLALSTITTPPPPSPCHRHHHYSLPLLHLCQLAITSTTTLTATRPPPPPPPLPLYLLHHNHHHGIITLPHCHYHIMPPASHHHYHNYHYYHITPQ